MGNKRRGDHFNNEQIPSKVARTDLIERRTALDAQWPDKVKNPPVPPYDNSRSLESKLSIPPLPPIKDDLAELTFTHSSSVDGKYSATNHQTYERLELLGDAYIEIIATRIIYSRFPHLLAGKQSSLRESLVKNTTLFSFAKAYRFHIRLTSTGFDINQKSWQKVLADVFEAYVAAVVLSSDAGFAVAEEWLTSLWADILLGKPDVDEKETLSTDWKTELAKVIGGKYIGIKYEPLRDRSGKHQGQEYVIAVYLEGWGYAHEYLGKGKGIGKTEAGMKAARDALTNSVVVRDAMEKKRVHDEERRAAMELARADEETKQRTAAAEENETEE